MDLLLALMAAEGLWLTARRHRGGSSPGNPWPFLAAGAAMLVALRLALTGAWWGWIALSLALSGIAHVLDLAGRWRRGQVPSGEDISR